MGLAADVDRVNHTVVGQPDHGQGSAGIVGDVCVLSVGRDLDDVWRAEAVKDLHDAQRIATEQRHRPRSQAADERDPRLSGHVLGTSRHADERPGGVRTQVDDREQVLALVGDQRFGAQLERLAADVLPTRRARAAPPRSPEPLSDAGSASEPSAPPGPRGRGLPDPVGRTRELRQPGARRASQRSRLGTCSVSDRLAVGAQRVVAGTAATDQECREHRDKHRTAHNPNTRRGGPEVLRALNPSESRCHPRDPAPVIQCEPPRDW